MMTAQELLDLLAGRGVEITATGDRLHVDAAKGVLTPELRVALVEHKPALLELLCRPDDPPPQPAAEPPWVGQRITIEDLPAFKERWGLRVARMTWPEGSPSLVAECRQKDGA